MRTMSGTGSGRLFGTAVAQRWMNRDHKQRADLMYQAATLAAAVLLLVTAVAI